MGMFGESKRELQYKIEDLIEGNQDLRETLRMSREGEHEAITQCELQAQRIKELERQNAELFDVGSNAANKLDVIQAVLNVPDTSAVRPLLSIETLDMTRD